VIVVALIGIFGWRYLPIKPGSGGVKPDLVDRPIPGPGPGPGPVSPEKPDSGDKPGRVVVPSRPSGYVRVADAKVTGLRFFESGKGFPPVDKRSFASRFAKSSRYINWQLDLDYPKRSSPLKFQVEAIWYKPDNSVYTRQNVTIEMQSGWNSSSHAMGYGSDKGGSFAPGDYTVDMLVGGERVARGRFEVYVGEAPPAGYIQSLNATVTSVKFFESGSDLPARDQRRYASQFRIGPTRYINWELNLAMPTRTSRADFTIHEVWRKPDGTIEKDDNFKTYVESGWATSWHTRGWGRADGGKWVPGTYRVDLYVDNAKVASGTFEAVY
jgi:hypothetical protein